MGRVKKGRVWAGGGACANDVCSCQRALFSERGPNIIHGMGIHEDSVDIGYHGQIIGSSLGTHMELVGSL